MTLMNAGLRHFRERANLSRTKLGAKANVDPATIYNLEEKGARPQLATAIALRDALAEALGEPLRIEDLFPAVPEEASA